jgi:hypothetical protein
VRVPEKTEESRKVVKATKKANASLELSALKPPPLPFEGYKPEDIRDSTPRSNISPEVPVLRPPPIPYESYRLGNSEESTPRAANGAQRNSIEAQEYTIAELQVATQSFAEENLIGEGVVGKVYKAELPDGNVCLDFNLIGTLYPLNKFGISLMQNLITN